MANPIVFLDITSDGAPMGRIVIQLYADMCPIAAENFRALCTGEKGIGFFGKPLHYKGSSIDHIGPGSYIEGGNIISHTPEDYKGIGESIYGANFKNEKSSKEHDRPGTLAMYGGDSGTEVNGSHFVICLKGDWYFQKYLPVFGQVVDGLDVVYAINNVALSPSGQPVKPITIADCGQIVSTKVFFDIDIGGTKVGRIVMKLYDDTNPKTAKKFRVLCTGEKGICKVSGKPLHYKGSSFYRVIPGTTCHGGDITDGDGTGLGESIYSPDKFEAENFVRKHRGPGVLSMLSSGYGECIGTQFFITTTKTQWLDGKHVVFGQVVEGMEVVEAIDKVGSANGKTTKVVTIVDCGQIYDYDHPIKPLPEEGCFEEPY